MPEKVFSSFLREKLFPFFWNFSEPANIGLDSFLGLSFSFLNIACALASNCSFSFAAMELCEYASAFEAIAIFAASARAIFPRAPLGVVEMRGC